MKFIWTNTFSSLAMITLFWFTQFQYPSKWPSIPAERAQIIVTCWENTKISWSRKKPRFKISKVCKVIGGEDIWKIERFTSRLGCYRKTCCNAMKIVQNLISGKMKLQEIEDSLKVFPAVRNTLRMKKKGWKFSKGEKCCKMNVNVW